MDRALLDDDIIIIIDAWLFIDGLYLYGGVYRPQPSTHHQSITHYTIIVTPTTTTTIPARAGGEIKHIRVNNSDKGYSLGKGKEDYKEIWDLIEAQLDKSLKSTKGDQAVQLVYVFFVNDSSITPPTNLKILPTATHYQLNKKLLLLIFWIELQKLVWILNSLAMVSWTL